MNFGRLIGTSIQNQEKGSCKGFKIILQHIQGKTKTPNRFENTLQFMGKASRRQHKNTEMV